MARAGRVTIDLVAGTAQFDPAIDKSTKKLQEFSGEHGHTVTAVQATSAALRDLELKFGTNMRAAERFLATTLNLGGVLQKLFPLAGGLAFSGMLYEMFEQVQKGIDRFRQLQEAPAKIREEFQNMTLPLKTANDELKISNDRLEIEIAKLERKPVNNLKLALDETTLASDKLAESMNKTFAEIQKTLEGTKIGFLDQLFGAASGKDLDEMMGGKSGAGGFRGQLAQLYSDYSEKLRAAGTEQEKQALLTQRDTQERKLLADALKRVNDELSREQGLQSARNTARQSPSTINTPYGTVLQQGGAQNLPEYTQNIERLQAVRERLEAAMSADALTSAHSSLEGKVAGLRGSQTSRFGVSDEMAKFARELAAAQGKFADAQNGGDSITQAMANGARKASDAIADLNKRLAEEGSPALTAAQKLKISLMETESAMYDALAAKIPEVRKREQEENRKLLDQDREREVQMQRADAELKRRQQEADAAKAKRDREQYSAMQGLEDQLKAVYGTREEHFQADRSAKSRDLLFDFDLTDEQRVNALAQMDKQHQLDNARAGIGQTAKDGYKQFFNQLRDNTKSAGQEVQDILGGAFNTIGNQLGAMLTGQKASWASFFQSLASTFATAGLNQLFGLIGNFGGGGGFGKILGSLFGGFRAGGGDVTGGSAYMVGERGPELPGASGSIVSNGALAGAGAGSGVSYYIDARGTDPVVTERNTRRALIATHQSAVQNGILGTAEMQRRRPR